MKQGFLLALISDDYFESFSPVREVVKTTDVRLLTMAKMQRFSEGPILKSDFTKISI